jgi:hypothetical protein
MLYDDENAQQRGFTIPRQVNIDLVIARNTAYARWQHAKKMDYDGARAAYRSMYYLLDSLLDETTTEDMIGY